MWKLWEQRQDNAVDAVTSNFGHWPSLILQGGALCLDVIKKVPKQLDQNLYRQVHLCIPYFALALVQSHSPFASHSVETVVVPGQHYQSRNRQMTMHNTIRMLLGGAPRSHRMVTGRHVLDPVTPKVKNVPQRAVMSPKKSPSDQLDPTNVTIWHLGSPRPMLRATKAVVLHEAYVPQVSWWRSRATLNDEYASSLKSGELHQQGTPCISTCDLTAKAAPTPLRLVPKAQFFSGKPRQCFFSSSLYRAKLD
jgi:hypothetical protein